MKQDACTMMPQTQDARTLAVDAVLFDLDGTLVDSVADLYLGVCGMLRDLGRPEIPVEDVRAYVGRGMHNLVKRVLAGSLDAIDDPAPAPQHAVDSFRRHYAEANGKHATCYPGVVEGLQMLKEKGIPMAVITNKPDAFTLPLIEQLGLGGFFDVVVGGHYSSSAAGLPSTAGGRVNCGFTLPSAVL